MSTAVKRAEQDLLAAGPEALLQRAEAAVASADKVLQAAKVGVRAAGGSGRRHRQRPASGARPRLAGDRRRGPAPDARLGRAALRRRPLRRVRAAAPRRRLRRIPGADLRRHSHGPARARASRAARRVARRRAPLRGRGRRRDHRRRHAGHQEAPRRLHRRAAQGRQLRRSGSRRDACRHSRPDAHLLRGGGHPARPRMASAERLHPARGGRRRSPSSACSG